MVAEIGRALAHLGVVAALSLAVLALAACGSSAEPTDETAATAPAPTNEPAIAPASTAEGAVRTG